MVSNIDLGKSYCDKKIPIESFKYLIFKSTKVRNCVD